MSSNVYNQSDENEKPNVKVGVARREDEDDDGSGQCFSSSGSPRMDDRKPAAISKVPTAVSQSDEKANYREQLGVAVNIIEQHVGASHSENAFASTTPGAFAVAGTAQNYPESTHSTFDTASTSSDRQLKANTKATVSSKNSRDHGRPGAEYVPRVAPGLRLTPASVPIRREEPLAAFVVTIAPVETNAMSPEESHPSNYERSKNLHKKYYLLAAIVACFLVGVAVVLGVILGAKDNHNNTTVSDGPKTYSVGPTMFGPLTTDCSTLSGQEQPNALSQCICTGNISIVAEDIAARYHNLTNTFIHTVYRDFNESLSSCSPQNQALVWLASGSGVTAESNLRQRYTLALLFTSWNGPSWTAKIKWLSLEDECSWEGLECNRQGEVISILLSTNNVVVDLASVAHLLTQLQTLTVDYNSFVGSTIPTEVGLLTNLGRFVASASGIRGTLPTELFTLGETLQYVDASSNLLTGTIPTEIGKLVQVETWNVGVKNTLSGTIPSEVGHCTNLVDLMLHGNNLNGTIPSDIGLLSNLQSMYLESNSLTGTIPTEIGHCVNLTSFDVSVNHLSGTLPTEMAKLPLYCVLCQLSIYGNLQLHTPEAVCKSFGAHNYCNGCDC